MDESEDNMSAEDSKDYNGISVKVKPKKRSLVERELETNLTPRVTSPVISDGVSRSRYGRARRIKADIDIHDTERVLTKVLKSPKFEKSPVKIQSPVYKMHASNSPVKMSSPNRVITLESSIENQIEKICNENISLSRFGSEENSKVSPAKKFTKVYMRKDLIQNKEKEETVTLIKNMFSPIKSASKTKNTHLNNILERSSEKYSLNGNISTKPQNGYSNMASVVKTLDFDSKKKKKDKDKMVLSKNEMFDIEARCEYQVGDLAWARVGTYPFWPCLITRDPESGTFVKNKLFGRVEHDVIHVTFFGDNGRRGWIVDNMLRKYTGLLEFESTRERFTPEAKKKDPRFYAAFFISEKKQHLWNISVEEAELLFREPKRLRIDVFNEMLEKYRASKMTPKRERSRKVTRTNSDVSLSESLYDTLFSEDDGKSDDHDRSKNRSRNKSLDVSEVVTACLDNMAAKTGITKIQRQSHMDRWLQKAKSKTPEKSQPKSQVILNKMDKESKVNKTKKKRPLPKNNPSQTPYILRRSLNESQNSSETKLTSLQNEHDYSIQSSGVEEGDVLKEFDKVTEHTSEKEPCILEEPVCGIGVILKVESLCDKPEENLSNVEESDVIMTIVNDEYFVTEQEVAEEIIVKEVDTVDISNVNTEKISTDETNVKEMNIDTSNIKNIALTEMDEYEHLNFITNSYKLEEELNKIYTVFPIPQSNKNIEESKIVNGDINKMSKNIYDAKINKTCVINSELANDEINLKSEDKFQEKSIIDKNRTEIGQIVKTDIIPNIDMGSGKSTNFDVIVKKNDNNISINEKESKHNDNEKEVSSIFKNSFEESVTAKDFVEHTFDKEVINDVIKENTEETKTKSDNEEIVKIDHTSKDVQSEIPSRKCDTSADKIINDDISKADNSEECIESEENYKIDITFKDERIEDNLDNSVVENMNNKCVLNVSSQNHNQHTELKEVDSIEECKSIDEDENKVIENNKILSSEELELNKISSDANITETDYPDVYCKDESTKILDDMVLSIVNYSANATVSNDKLLSDRSELETESLKENGLHEDVENNSEKILNDDLETTSVQSTTINNKTNYESKLSPIEHKANTKNKENHSNKVPEELLNNPEFMVYLEHRQDELMEEHPELVHDEVVEYLYKTWLYKENLKSDSKKADDIKSSNLVKGLNTEHSQKKSKRHFKDKIHKVIRSNTLDQYLNKHVSEKADKKEEVEDLDKLGHKNASEITNIENMILSEKMDIDKSEHKIQCKEEKPTDKQDSFATKSTETREGGEIRDYLQKKAAEDVENDADLRSPISEDVTKIISINVKNEDNVLENKIEGNECDPPEIDNSDKLIDRKLSPVENNLSEHSLELVKQNIVVASIESSPERKLKNEINSESAFINSEDSGISLSKRRMRVKNSDKLITKINMSKALEDPEFLKYLELRQDALTDEHPELTQDEIISYLYSTWVYEENLKSERMKTDEIDNSNLVKGLNQEPISQARKVKRKPKVQKTINSYFNLETTPKNKPNRSTVKPYYNEDFSDIEDEIEIFEIFKRENEEEANEEKTTTTKPSQVEPIKTEILDDNVEITESDEINDVELYFADLTKPKPNIFKGLVREKVCEICEKSLDLVKCNGCRGMFHVDCVKKELEVVEVPIPMRGRKKKKKPRGRKQKNLDDSNGMDSESQSDDKSQDANVSEEQNMSIEDDFESHLVIEAESFEAQLSAKMKELLESAENVEYESPSEELDWSDTEAGKCQIVDIKLRTKDTINNIDYSDFKCNSCQKFDIPVCFVCKSAVSPKTRSEHRQRCQIAHCHKYYHIECLDHWPQTQFNSWEPSKNYESLSCPRHVCHTCVSDDPRGCKTRFSGDKLARCVRCPATYHSFTKCLPAGSQILTASHIICPRHYEHRPGKVPCHVNTGWCFICALGGTLICCEYCPTSFHAECLNIKPPEGGYMCEDCETGRLPLYGEMVWVKLGHYRWWPGIILHPSEIPHNIMAVKHSPGEFVVRFFGQYDYYWVNRGRVFPFQEGDSGRISSQRSKIDAAFTTAMEHAQKAFEILKKAHLNQEESQDIAMSLLPPHYVKLKVNKPCGSLCGRKIDVEESSLTQCECNPDEEEPCGPYSQCLNRMLLTECGPSCKAGDRCNNRAFEKRLYPKLIPYRTPQRGWGLKTLEDIKQGQFVIEYVGELIDEAEFQRRMRRKHETRDENFYFLTLDKERMIDAGPKGNLARFMNHCCEPNCETQKWTVLGDVRVGLFAMRDIPANSEVTFNYNLECAGIDKKRCLCGAKRCSGYIGAKPKQDESQPKKGKLPAKRTYKKRKNIEESPSTSKSKMVKPKTVKPIKPKELTEIEKDLIIIKNATNGISSDSESSGRLSSIESDKVNHRPLKRKRVSFSTDEVPISNSAETKSQTMKRVKLNEDIVVNGENCD